MLCGFRKEGVQSSSVPRPQASLWLSLLFVPPALPPQSPAGVLQAVAHPRWPPAVCLLTNAPARGALPQAHRTPASLPALPVASVSVLPSPQGSGLQTESLPRSGSFPALLIKGPGLNDPKRLED